MVYNLNTIINFKGGISNYGQLWSEWRTRCHRKVIENRGYGVHTERHRDKNGEGHQRYERNEWVKSRGDTGTLNNQENRLSLIEFS